MATLEPMICPRCGATMNHHGDKVVNVCSREPSRQLSTVFYGVVEEAFQCPACGWADVRIAS